MIQGLKGGCSERQINISHDVQNELIKVMAVSVLPEIASICILFYNV
jgi:hypothetical protein